MSGIFVLEFSIQTKLVGGWTTHLNNMLVKLDHFPKNQGKKKHVWNHHPEKNGRPTPSNNPFQQIAIFGSFPQIVVWSTTFSQTRSILYGLVLTTYTHVKICIYAFMALIYIYVYNYKSIINNEHQGYVNMLPVLCWFKGPCKSDAAALIKQTKQMIQSSTTSKHMMLPLLLTAPFCKLFWSRFWVPKHLL